VKLKLQVEAVWQDPRLTFLNLRPYQSSNVLTPAEVAQVGACEKYEQNLQIKPSIFDSHKKIYEKVK
jgi:hypothetical protein